MKELVQPGLRLDMPSDASVSAAKGLRVLADIVLGITSMLAVIFLLSIIPMTFTNLGQWKLAGVHLITIASHIAQGAVYGALISAIVAAPIKVKCENVIKCSALAHGAEDASLMLQRGEVTQAEFDEARRGLGMLYRAIRTQSNCFAMAYILGGIAGFIVHDPLMDIAGNPWADLVTLVVIPLLGSVLSALITPRAMRKYEKEDPVLFREVEAHL